MSLVSLGASPSDQPVAPPAKPSPTWLYAAAALVGLVVLGPRIAEELDFRFAPPARRRNPGRWPRRRKAAAAPRPPRNETPEERARWFAAANAETKRRVDAYLRRRAMITTPAQAKAWARAYLRRHPGSAYSAPPLNVLAAFEGWPPDWSPQRYRSGLNKAQAWMLYRNRRR